MQTRNNEQHSPAVIAAQPTPTPREDYERLHAALETLFDLESERVPGLLDLDPLWESDDNLLSRAIDRHLHILFDSVDFFTPEGMRLYVEMRLLLDAQKAQRVEDRDARAAG